MRHKFSVAVFMSRSMACAPPTLKPDLSSLSLNDEDDTRNVVPPGGGDEERIGSRKRRALSSVDFATEVAVRRKADIADDDEEEVEKEESKTDIGEDFDEEDGGLSGSFSFDGETPPQSSNKSSSSLIARVGAKIRRLNLTQDDDEGGDDVDNIDDSVGGLAGWFRESSSVKKKKKRLSIVVEGGGGTRCPPPSPAIGRGERFINDRIDCSDLSRRIVMNDRMTTDDVSPRDVINFPSFSTKINSPSQPILDNDGDVIAAAAGDNYDGNENTGDKIDNSSPPSSAYKIPPPSTMKTTKTRRRILDDDSDDHDDRMVVAEDRPHSSPPPRPQGLRTLGRANSFLQMFSFSSVSSDTIVEEETSPIGSLNKTNNDNGDDFIRRPDYDSEGGFTTNDIKMDFATKPSSPQRPIRNTHHRRYTPASPPASGKDDGKCSDSFSRFVSDFEIVGTLGNGTFGSVYSVRNRTDRRLYAIKAAKREARGTNDRDRMLQEVFALSSLSDKACVNSMHIVRYHQAWMEGNRLYIQTELCDGTLLDQMRQGGVVIDEQGRYKLLREILLALKLVHETGMIHLDIKPENIFRKSGMYKLGDFGLVSKIENHDDVEEGDSRYMSLELLRGELDDLTKVRHYET